MSALDDDGLRKAVGKRLGRSLDDVEWDQALAQFESDGNHEPFDDAHVSELAEQLRTANIAMQEFAAVLRARLSGHESPAFLNRLLEESAEAALEMAVWLRWGKAPAPDHDVRAGETPVQSLMRRRSLLDWIVSSAIACEIIVRRFKVSHGAAAIALLGGEGGAKFAHRSWLFELVIEQSMDALDTVWRARLSGSRDERLLGACDEILAQYPAATWQRRWEVYQRDFAGDTGISFIDSPANFKKAVQRASARRERDTKGK